MKTYLFKVKSKTNVQDFLLSELNLSLNIINKIKSGCIFVDGAPCKSLFDVLNANSKVEIVLPKDEVNPYLTPNNYPLEVVYEDEYILAVIKPKGMLTHSSKYNKAPTLESAVVSMFNEPFTFRSINRLDKDTSGIVIIAKDIISASYFNNLIKANGIKKTYQAVVVGKPNKQSFIIDAPIERESEHSIKRVVSPIGKQSKTECLNVKELPNNLSMVEVLLHTGRTHQIRVHFSYIGHPLFGDALYGEKVDGKTYTLHAGKIEFTHPFTSEKILLTAPLKELF